MALNTPRTTTTAEITWEDLLRMLEERPEWLARVRGVVLTHDLLSLPEAVRELVEAHRRAEERLTRLEATVQELVEVQRRHEERLAGVEARLERLEATVQELVEAQRRHEERLAGVEARLERLEATVQELVEVQRRHEERLTGVEARLERLETTVRELVEVQRRHEERLTGVEARLERLEATVQELVEAQERTNQQIQELREAQERTNQQIQAIWEAIRLNTAQLKDLTEVAQSLVEGQRRLEGTVGDMKGILLEMKYRERPYAYFGHVLRGIRVVPMQAIEDELEARLAWEEVKEVFRLDLLLKGRLRDAPEQPEVWLAVEVSSVVDKGDVERAGRRAALLRKAGFPAVPVAAGLAVDEEARWEAEGNKVVVVRDGQVSFWDEALRHYLS
ncbi:MAG: hypothetical protein H5T61_15320 [Thermoflexales bacterium]|nr:hypothetical protein [Thermoflexales bacterium]